MPHLRFRSLTSEQVAKASLELPLVLAPIMQTTLDNFTFEKLETHFYEDGKPVSSYPFAEVCWFKRTQEVQDSAALQITQILKTITQSTDIIVTFYEIPRENYYENGQHF